MVDDEDRDLQGIVVVSVRLLLDHSYRVEHAAATAGRRAGLAVECRDGNPSAAAGDLGRDLARGGGGQIPDD
jgi:hypothetical protein